MNYITFAVKSRLGVQGVWLGIIALLILGVAVAAIMWYVFGGTTLKSQGALLTIVNDLFRPFGGG